MNRLLAIAFGCILAVACVIVSGRNNTIDYRTYPEINSDQGIGVQIGRKNKKDSVKIDSLKHD